jgi:hypothetical protein
MGKFTYGAEPVSMYIDDRTLWHLKVVILDKLRRNESFTFTWLNSSSQQSQRDCVWLNQAIPLHFQFADSAEPALNGKWLQELVQAANSVGGLRVISEEPPFEVDRNPPVDSTGIL